MLPASGVWNIPLAGSERTSRFSISAAVGRVLFEGAPQASFLPPNDEAIGIALAREGASLGDSIAMFFPMQGSHVMPHSVLDAIRLGVWDFEPADQIDKNFSATEAMPGTDAKLSVLAERVRQGLPLWHPSDRQEYDDPRPQDNSPRTDLI